MTNWYTHRDRLKDALNLPATSTGDHDQLDEALETASRLIDDWVGYHFYAQVGTRHFTARDTQRISFPTPFTSISALRTDDDGDATYETTWSTASYYLEPDNATLESPPQPFWSIRVRQDSTVVFPAEVDRGVQLAGTWGYYDRRTTSTAVLSTALNSTSLRIEVTGATSLHPGQTIVIDNEAMFVAQCGLSGSATATTSGSVFVQRAVNGTSATTHTSGTAIQIHTYPLAEHAALRQAAVGFRGTLGDPSQGGPDFGQSYLQTEGRWGEGDLIPSARRILRGFRKPSMG